MHDIEVVRAIRTFTMHKSADCCRRLYIVTIKLPGLHDFACNQRGALCLASSTPHLPSGKLSGIEEGHALPPLAFNSE